MPDASPPVADAGQLRWRCRRGMKELDRLLSAYLERDFPSASAAEQSGFRELLELQDPVLYDYCLGRERPSAPHLAALIDRIVQAPVRA